MKDPIPKTQIEFKNAQSIVVSGDIHGDFTQLVFKCCVQYEMKDTLIIVAGDCGFGFERPGHYENIYKRCSSRLTKNNNWIVFVRGNHDNPAYFNIAPIKHPRWMTVPDYTILKACGHTILCVGGAISVDRTYRKNSKYYHEYQQSDSMEPNVYWADEPPKFDQGSLDIIDKQCAIDTVITHTSPSFCEKTSHIGLEDWAKRDESLLDNVKQERTAMDNLLGYLYSKNHPLSYWFYGHFHQSWFSEIDGVKYNLLDCMELRQIPPKEF